MARVNRITRDDAETLAIQALEYLTGDPAQLRRFLSLAGLEPQTLRTAARDPQFLAGVLEYITAEEPLLLAVARHLGRPPGELVSARDALAGPPWERDTP